jgi:hypothetical protein
MQLDLSVWMQAIGVGFILIGISIRTGLWKNWYWRSRGGNYGYIPMGIIFLLYAFQEQLTARLGLPVLVGIFVVIIAIAVWFAMRTPAFMKPAWVIRVEKHPKKIIHLMAEDVTKGEKWEPWVENQAEVDAWAARVTKKLPKDK